MYAVFVCMYVNILVGLNLFMTMYALIKKTNNQKTLYRTSYLWPNLSLKCKNYIFAAV